MNDDVRGGANHPGAEGPLAGLRVFDATLVLAGPWASMILGSLGAEVLHVERPDVDWSQLGGPVMPRMSGMATGYLTWNMNKKGVALDFKDPEDLATTYDLIETCDVFVSNMRPRAFERIGLGYERLRRLNPRLVYALLTGHGMNSRRANDRAGDSIVQAMTGFWSSQGAREGIGEMLRDYTQMDTNSGNVLAQAILLALHARTRSGSGQFVEVTMLGAGATLQTPRFAESLTGFGHRPQGSSAFGTAPDRAFCSKDGAWIGVSVTSDPEWRALCTALDRPEWLLDARFSTNSDRVAHRAALEQSIADVVATMPRDYWSLTLSNAGVPWGSPMRWDELRYHVQVLDNDYLLEGPTAAWGDMWTGGPPWRFSRTPARTFGPPLPGTDTPGVKDDLVRDEVAGEPPGSTARGADVGGPLGGVRVVELAEGVAGPMTGMLLGDAGADVIKVETSAGDRARTWVPECDGVGAVFAALNRNKRAVALRPGSAEELSRLVELADVLVVDDLLLDAVTLDLDALMARNERLVVCVITGWGPKGPWARRPAGELPVQLAAEVTSSLGRAGDEPVRVGADLAGAGAASYAMQAIVAALLSPVRGQRIDVSLFGALLNMRSTHWGTISNPDEWIGPHPESYLKPPEHNYTCKDRRVFMSVGRQVDDMVGLVEDLNMEFVLDDPRWPLFCVDPAGNTGTYAYVIHDLWDRGLAQWTYEEAAEIIGRHGGWVFPCYSYEEFVEDDDVKESGLFAELDGVRQLRPPWHFGDTPASLRMRAPSYDEHGEAIRRMIREDGRWDSV